MSPGFFPFKPYLKVLQLGCHRESGSKEFTQRNMGKTPKIKKLRSRNRSLSLNGRRAPNRLPLSLQSWWSYPELMIQTFQKTRFENCSSSSPIQKQKQQASICYSPSPRRSTHWRATVLLALPLQIQLARSTKVHSTSHTSKTPRA